MNRLEMLIILDEVKTLQNSGRLISIQPALIEMLEYAVEAKEKEEAEERTMEV